MHRSRRYATMHEGAGQENMTMDDVNASTLAWNRPDVRDALARGDWPIVLRAFFDSGLADRDRRPDRPLPVPDLAAG
jgi:hypothetical protein